MSVLKGRCFKTALHSWGHHLEMFLLAGPPSPHWEAGNTESGDVSDVITWDPPSPSAGLSSERWKFVCFCYKLPQSPLKDWDSRVVGAHPAVGLEQRAPSDLLLLKLPLALWLLETSRRSALLGVRGQTWDIRAGPAGLHLCTWLRLRTLRDQAWKHTPAGLSPLPLPDPVSPTSLRCFSKNTLSQGLFPPPLPE